MVFEKWLQKQLLNVTPLTRAYLKLQVASLASTTTSATETALREWCTKAESEVDRLQMENNFLKEINVAQSQLLDDHNLAAQGKKEVTATSADLGPLSFPTLSRGKRADDLCLSIPGGGISGLSMPRVSPLHAVG